MLKRNEFLALTVDLQIVEMFALDDHIYYLARVISRGKEGLTTADLVQIPLILLCADSEVTKIPDEVLQHARQHIAEQYSDEDDGPEKPS